MRKMLFLAVAGMLLLSGQVWAQTRTITGKVTDERSNPVPNASVLIKGTSTGTTTKADGSFSLTFTGTARQLEISSVGYTTQTIGIGSSNLVNVTLLSNANEIAEVVVTGYTRENKSKFSGAVTTMSSKVVETVPVGAFDQALQGRAPGMQVTSGSGQPGSSATITIRGIHSITGAGSQPLIIMDGVPLPAGDLQTVNPNDFESITVLKDASAAAMYGARGGLGVIVITTKKGKAGTNNFSYRTQVGFTQPPNWNKFDMMNTQEILQYEEWLGMNGFATNTPGWVYSKNNPTYAAASPAEKALRDHLLDSISQINTDYKDLLFRNGFSQTHEINLSGGTDKTRFFLSAGLFDQEGTDLFSDLKRYTTRFNLDHHVGKLNIQFNTLAGYSITNFAEGERLGNSARNSFQMAWRAKPYENPYKPDGTLNYGANTTLALKQIANVIEGMENTITRQNQVKINSGLTLAYKLLPFLTAKNTLGIDVSEDRWQRFIRPSSYIGSLQANGNSGINSEAYKINTQIINTSSLVFSQQFNSIHEVEAGAFFEVVRGYQKGLGFTMYNLDPRLEQTGQGAGLLPTPTANQFPTSAKSGYGIRSYFATARYTYNNKYTINGNIRRDGTSRIANEENKEITTWSAGLTWNANEEMFIKNQNFLSDLRVRLSYGSVPNIGSIGTLNYGAGGGLISVTNYLGPQIPSFGSAAYQGSSISGQAPSTPGNPNLKIETIQKFNFGVDFSMWRNRARFIVDLYHEKTIDLFVSQQIPGTAGFGVGYSILINAGTMRNKGIEMAVAVDVVKTKDIDLTIGANHAINDNKILDLGQVNEIPQGTFVIREGLPYGSHYTTHYLGADPATGAPMFEREDGTTTTNTAQAFNFAKYGTFMPKHVGGFTVDFRYKAISVGALFSYQFDVTRYNNIENWVRRGITGYHASVNASRVLLTEQWQKPGDVKFYQFPAFDRGFNSSDIQDAKFLRFRNLNVAYNLPEISVAGTRIIKSARFYVQLQNVILWSPWRGPDPEDNNNISLNEFPNPRMFVTGIDINF